jgi:hypothetical protein
MDLGKFNKLFTIMVIILCGIATVFGIVNAIYFGKISSRPSASIPHGTATAMVWLNVILTVFSAVLFGWGMWRLFKADHIVRQHLKNRWIKFHSRKGETAPQPQLQSQMSHPQPQMGYQFDHTSMSNPIDIQRPRDEFGYD